ncbi:MAG: gluconeogenesis factor YvcK family protein [Candidatus Nanopelagicales bacterium]
MKALAFGGGHGLKASLNALLLTGAQVGAVVVVSDDGGSSGRIRQSYPVLPPGDIRMAFETLSQDENWSQLLGHRFGGVSELTAHAVGNLILLALFEKYENPQQALNEFGQLVNSQGQVFALSLEPLEIVASVNFSGEVKEIIGQKAVASTSGEIKSIKLVPEKPIVSSEVISQIEQADLLIFGPGSWWTSVIPHFQIEPIREAISQATAKKIVVNNLTPEKGETENYQPATFLKVLKAAAGEIKFDYVINQKNDQDLTQLETAVSQLGAENLFVDVTLLTSEQNMRGLVHDYKKLALIFNELRIGGLI